MEELRAFPMHEGRLLVDRLRETVRAARANLQIRARLRSLVAEPDWLDAVVKATGPSHAVLHELLEIVRHAGGGEDRAARP